MKRNKLKVLSILALSGLAIAGLTACTVNVNTDPTTGQTTTTAVPTTTATPTATTATPTTTVAPTTTAVPTTTAPVKVIDMLDVTGYKENYTIGEAFTLAGLEVTKIYDNGDSEVAAATEYEAKLYSDKACTTEANVTTFATAGTYYLKITLGTKSTVKNITVTAAQYEVRQLFDASTLAVETLTSNKELFSNNGVNVTALWNSGKNILIDANPYPGTSHPDANVGDYKFTQRIKLDGSALGTGETALTVVDGEVTNSRVLKVVVPQATTIRVAARSTSSDVRTLVLTDNKNVNKELSAGPEADMDVASATVEAGTYYLYSKSSSLYIYGIEFVYNVDKSSVQYSEIKAEDTKTEYNINDTYSTEGLTVKALNQYGLWDVITDYTVKNSAGEDVVLNTPGVNTLKVSALGLETTYDINVIAADAKTQTLTVTTPAKDLVYKQGEKLSFTNLVITAVDQYNISTEVVVSDALAVETPTVTYKVLQGETDVTANWATLSAGKYSVQLTYDDATTSYEVTVVAKSGATFNLPNVLAIGATAYKSSVTVSYSDGTNVIVSEAVEVKSNEAGYVTKFYSDAEGTNEIDLATAAAAAGTVYVQASYDGYKSELTAVTVKSISEDSAIIADLGLTAGTNYKGQTLYTGSLIKLEGLSGEALCEVDPNINNGNATIKINGSNSLAKGVQITAIETVSLKIYLNANGSNKIVKIIDKNGAVLKEITVSKSATTNVEVEVTLSAGDTIKICNDAGGGRFVGVVATKAD